jgi:hypothetical protein
MNPERKPTMTRLTLIASAIAFSAGVAAAGPFGLPDHEPNGFRDTGCDAAARVEIRNGKGDLLYVQNPTCKQNLGFSSTRLDAGPDGTLGTADDRYVSDN